MLRKAFGLALLLAMLQPVLTQETTSSRLDKPSTNPRPTKPRPQSEAGFYAAGYGVATSEAERRVRIMAALGNEAAELLSEFKPRFAGIFLDHSPDFRIVVRLTGKSPVPSRQAVTKAGSIPIVFVTGASATFEEMNNALEFHRDELYSSIPLLQGMYVDERTGDIVLMVYANDAESKAYEAELPALSRLLGHPVRFEFQESATQEIAAARGGALTTSCTTGFAVVETTTGRKGVLTAAHCPNAQSYANYVTPGQPGYITFPCVRRRKK